MADLISNDETWGSVRAKLNGLGSGIGLDETWASARGRANLLAQGVDNLSGLGWHPGQLGNKLKKIFDPTLADRVSISSSVVTKVDNALSGRSKFSQGVSSKRPSYSTGTVAGDGVDDFLEEGEAYSFVQAYQC